MYTCQYNKTNRYRYHYQFKMSAPMVGHLGKGQPCWKTIFYHKFATNFDTDTNIVFKISTLQLLSDMPIYKKVYGKRCVLFKRNCLTLENGMINR